MLKRKPTKEEKIALKIFLHKTPVFRTYLTVDKNGNDVYLGYDFQHRGYKALKVIEKLFSKEDAFHLRDALTHIDSIKSFYGSVSCIYRKNCIDLKTFEII